MFDMFFILAGFFGALNLIILLILADPQVNQ